MQQLKVGSTLQGGKYIIEKVLGQGGFGITYLANQEFLDRKVCIKEFFFKEYCERDEATSQVSLGTQTNKEMVERFMAKFVKEARTISQLEHPNIIRIFDVFKENNTAYYVMEYIEGESLGDMVNRRGRIPEEEALGYILPVADALDYVHQKRINHLDVKPGNIMVRNSDQRVLLIDFGLSKQYDAGGNQTSTTPVGISHGYAPIEQYKQNGVQSFSPQTDIYSLGATLYKLLSGNTPPQPSDILDEGLPELPSCVSETTRNAVKQAMQVRRMDRPQSMKMFWESLSVINSKREDDKREEVSCGYQCKQEIEETKIITNPKENAKSVDLGLSVKWAVANCGAEKPWERGGLMDWEGCSDFKLGVGWRMPTRDEMMELLRECSFVDDMLEGVQGFTVIGPNGNSIFLPYTDYGHGTVVEVNTNTGRYWTGTENPHDSEQAYYLFISSGIADIRQTRKHFGFAVRPIYNEGEIKITTMS